MLKPFRQLITYISDSRGAKITLIAWIVVVITLSLFAPSAKDYETNGTGGSIKQTAPSEIAEQIDDEQFPSEDGLTALLVFHRESKLTDIDREKIMELSEWLASEEKPSHITNTLQFHEFPAHIQEQMFSSDKTTLLFNVSLEDGIESSEAHDTLEKINDKVSVMGFDDLQFEITGPAGITADTIILFKDADVVLMLATISLIFILLILIYRSPLLALTPLIIASIVYAVVDGLLGLAGKYNLFVIEGQAVSIMLVLLFAVVTDYSLFIFSRYREELKKNASKYTSMSHAMNHVSEPIFFSGSTIFLAMLTLFATIFEPYNHFAPVFSLAIVVILIAGLTLIPSVFALMGRKAFWPFIPKVETTPRPKRGFWTNVGKRVKKYPGIFVGVLMVFLLIGAANVPSINYSFNLMKSFPEDISSRKGFELLEEHYHAGQLAPLSVIVESNQPIHADEDFLQKMEQLRSTLNSQDGIRSVDPDLTDKVTGKSELPNEFLAESNQAVKFTITFDHHPYETEALNTVENLREKEANLLRTSGLQTTDYTIHYAGQTAQQLDIKQMNQRDMIVLFTLVTVLLTFVLGFQTRSVIMPIVMMGSIVLSYVATLGLSWWIFQHVMNLDAISYRLPVYTFVFMVALGIDYNIMLVSRIKEHAQHLPWTEAVSRGVSLTGGVISSAGLILAATFSILMTQPLQELFLFGFTMTLGILLDTFLIRGFLLPSFLIILYQKKTKQT